MKKDATIICIIAGCLVLLDSIYLWLMKNAFNQQISRIQGSPIQLFLLPAVICYISLIFGLYYFIIREKKSIKDAFLLGLVIYSVFDLTNLALLRNWSPIIALIDSLWGGVLFGLTTALVYSLRLHAT
jgi:uncharacterized membrane protein